MTHAWQGVGLKILPELLLGEDFERARDAA